MKIITDSVPERQSQGLTSFVQADGSVVAPRRSGPVPHFGRAHHRPVAVVPALCGASFDDGAADVRATPKIR
jgi:hypothetical protein